MSDFFYQLLAIIIYLVGMLTIGWYAYRKTYNLSDYMLAGRSLRPAVAALSAGASDMSGWLLMGLPGAIYVNGLADAWIAIGLTIGAYLNWLFVAPRLRTYTQVSNDSITIPSFLDNRLKKNVKILRIVSGIIIFIFFTFYVSSGMVAGGVFFESSFDLDYHVGLFIMSAVVVIYTLFGGFLGVSLTDFVQGTIMFFALLLVPLVGVFVTGGIGETTETIQAVNPQLLSLVTGTSFLGIISAASWGLGYFGQPHIIVRFMAIKTVKETKQARRIGIGWMILSLVGAIATAFVGIAYFQQHPDVTLTDSEAVFIDLGQILFHPFLAGVMLAAVLAAIMSTVSSQLLVTSSALVEDIYKAIFKTNLTDLKSVLFGRISVLIVSVIALILAWEQSNTILNLVSFAWAGFGASFGPVILLSLYWRKLTGIGALSGMIVGALTVIIWGNTDLKDVMYEIVPGFLLSFIVTYVVSIFTYRPNEEIDREFDETVSLLKNES
ncbi:sodium/proline symporter PutP [Fervidibacillus albus]|uniref:Sodium/proline symporter n=1 Tax=Fervidibacillus albus TaxID=2980026 RepID=A0A9E8RWQ1_9BACI|nr:sodium/proline symporter PutP [Fervidibacillus albus]WAA08657.1 sodium/proline symporter PutP [Fervidibacillus albus]